MNLNMCNSLIKWFKVLQIKQPHDNITDLCDGIAISLALHEFSPEIFTNEWLSKIKLDVTDNWRLKLSNLRKVNQAISDYYSEVLNITLSDLKRPDVSKIVEKHDENELGRLLQLVLGCAVNCTHKQKYITQIMELEESLQRNIMQILQELDSIIQGSNNSGGSGGVSDSHGGAASGGGTTAGGGTNISTSLSEKIKDELAQRCHEAESQITLLINEKLTLQQEINKLQDILKRNENSGPLIGDDCKSFDPVQLGSARLNELHRQCDTLKEELLQTEAARDDFKIKSVQQEKEMILLQAKLEDYHQTSTQLAQLKDEIDVLRESNDKLKIYETQVTTFKKKLEDYNDLKKQIKLIEEQNLELMDQNRKSEDDMKKLSQLKGQIDLYKKEIEVLHVKLDTEMSKSVKIEFEMNNLNGKLLTLTREKDNLLQERDSLRELNDELQCNRQLNDGDTNTVSKELLSPSLKEKILRLEAENKALREGQGGQTALAQLLHDANERSEKLREELTIVKQKNLTLSEQLPVDDVRKAGGSGSNPLVIQLKQALELNEQRSNQIDDAQTQIAQLQSKVGQLEAALAAREHELHSADIRNRKLIEKAKEVIKTLEPRANEIMMDKMTDNDDGPSTRSASMGTEEERLLTTAFYRFTQICQRDAVDAKIALLSSSGQSFLSRQRQPTSRNPVNNAATFSKAN